MPNKDDTEDLDMGSGVKMQVATQNGHDKRFFEGSEFRQLPFDLADHCGARLRLVGK